MFVSREEKETWRTKSGKTGKSNISNDDLVTFNDEFPTLEQVSREKRKINREIGGKKTLTEISFSFCEGNMVKKEKLF